MLLTYINSSVIIYYIKQRQEQIMYLTLMTNQRSYTESICRSERFILMNKKDAIIPSTSGSSDQLIYIVTSSVVAFMDSLAKLPESSGFLSAYDTESELFIDLTPYRSLENV